MTGYRRELRGERCDPEGRRGGYEAAVKVTDEALSLGENGKMELTEQSGPYPCLHPALCCTRIMTRIIF